MAQKTNKIGENDAESSETGSFKLLSTAELAASEGVTVQYIGRPERAGVIEKTSLASWLRVRWMSPAG
jgi:hypothetical protein